MVSRFRHTLSRCLATPVVLAAAFAAFLPITQAVAQDAPHGSLRHVHGIVEDSASGRAIQGAEITIEVPGGSQVAAARVFRKRADSQGRFDFLDLPASIVTLRVRAIGYAQARLDLDLTAGDRLITLHLVVATTTLAEVDVRADTLAERLGRVMATSTLNAAALAETRGQTLGETIKNLPGVSVIQFGPSIAKPVIRGLNSQRVLVMNAGLRQEDQQWGTEHAPNIDTFDANSITVVRGAATVLYGADALGGVVRVDQAVVPDTGGFRGDVAFNLFSNSRQGALSLGAEAGNVHLPWIGALGYRARISTRAAGNGAAPNYSLSNTGFRELNGSLAAGVTRSWGSTDVRLSRFGTELGVLRQAHVGNAEDLERAMTTEPRDSAFSYTIGRPNQRVEHSTLRVRSQFTLPREQVLEVVYGLQYNHRREYDNHGPLRFRNEAAFNLKLFSNTLDIRWSHPRWNGLRGTVGTSALVQGNQTLGKAFLIPGYDLWQGALYAQEEMVLGRLSLNAGLRGDAISQTTIAYADLGIRSAAGTRRWQNFSGSFGAAYLLADGLDVSVRAARAWRPPTVNERYAQGVHHGTAQYELGDASLNAEQSNGVETTLRYRARTLQIEAAAYRNQLSGFIYLQPTQPILTIRGTFPGYRYAQTDARMSGLELSSSWTPTARWQLLTNGTLVRGRDRVNGGPLYDMPADRLSISTRMMGARSTLGSWFVGAGTQLVRRQDGVPEGTIYTLPTSGYALMQLEAGTAGLALGARRVDVSLSINNALNTRYRDYLSRYRLFVDDVGRDVVLRVNIPI